MDRNLVVAIVLSVLIIIGFQYYYQAVSPPPKRPPVKTEQAKQPDSKQPQEAKKTSEAPTKAQPERPAVSSPVVSMPAPQGGEEPAKDVTVKVEGLTYEAIVSSVGAKIVSFKLKDYKLHLTGPELVNLFSRSGPDTSGPSIELTGRDETLGDSALRYHYDSDQTEMTLTEKGQTKSIVFRATTAVGLTIVKTYTFQADSYRVGFSFKITNNSSENRNYLVSFPWKKVYKGEGTGQFSWNSTEILLNGELKDYYFKDIKGDEEPSGKIEWAGLGDVYFFKALVFGQRPAHKVTLFKVSNDETARILVRYGDLDLPAGKSANTDLALYLGPKERKALAAAGDNLSRALFYSHYRILEYTSEYLMKFLRFCNSGFEVFGVKIPGTHNYGWDIILLTIFIKILFIPLTHKSMKSMKRMQELQPQIAKLKEKYKDDKAALNKATMELFRENKANPLGGCWPMFLQLPVFIALYQALSYAIELRHAPFVCIPSIYLCINDLSAPDPYYVTPIIMGGTMVLQQWMTPSAGDPMQKKMMLLMPVIFTYMFLSFPSGLVLYWLVSNLLSVGQQVLTNRMTR